MGKNAAYAAQYAEEAKEQMRRYGIPASVILAQAILEAAATDRANFLANATITSASRLRIRG
jgi:flagellum-specific peptidoglycan hydrolase FlgJ